MKWMKTSKWTKGLWIVISSVAMVAVISSTAPFVFINFENRVRHNQEFDRETNEPVISLINQALRLIYQKDSVDAVSLDKIFTQEQQNSIDQWFFRNYWPVLWVDRNYMQTMWVSQSQFRDDGLVVRVRTFIGIFDYEIHEFSIIQKDDGSYIIRSVGLCR